MTITLKIGVICISLKVIDIWGEKSQELARMRRVSSIFAQASSDISDDVNTWMQGYLCDCSSANRKHHVSIKTAFKMNIMQKDVHQ